MRWFKYNEYDIGDLFANDGHIVVTISEEDIRKEYYPYWYKQMCIKFGSEVVDQNYSFEHCLDDWMTVNWAWEITSDQERT